MSNVPGTLEPGFRLACQVNFTCYVHLQSDQIAKQKRFKNLICGVRTVRHPELNLHDHRVACQVCFATSTCNLTRLQVVSGVRTARCSELNLHDIRGACPVCLPHFNLTILASTTSTRRSTCMMSKLLVQYVCHLAIWPDDQAPTGNRKNSAQNYSVEHFSPTKNSYINTEPAALEKTCCLFHKPANE